MLLLTIRTHAKISPIISHNLLNLIIICLEFFIHISGTHSSIFLGNGTADTLRRNTLPLLLLPPNSYHFTSRPYYIIFAFTINLRYTLLIDYFSFYQNTINFNIDIPEYNKYWSNLNIFILELHLVGTNRHQYYCRLLYYYPKNCVCTITI